jgi:glycosyltransferase involved in cell wall biosynthesis
MRRAARLAVVTSHPIQYQGPMFRMMADHPRIDPHVFFCCDHGQKPTLDRDFNATFAWERPITEGYAHEFVPSIHPRPAPYGFWPLTNPDLWPRLRRDRFDAVLLVGWGFASQWIAAAAARAHGLPILLRGESGADAWMPRPAWKEAVRSLVLGAFFRRVDAFLAIGTHNAELYRSLGVPDDRIFLSPYSVDNGYFARLADAARSKRRQLRERLGVRDDRPIVVTSGKLIARKAPLDLLRAFVRARARVPSKLVFLGDGELRAEVTALAATAGLGDDVVVTGFRQQAELGDVYAAADLFVLPTRFETWGLVINEAMLFSLPVVCTDRAPAHRDLIEPGVTGDVYPAGDVDALAALLELRLADVRRLATMGEAARLRFSGWSLERCVDGVAVALDRVLSSPS